MTSNAQPTVVVAGAGYVGTALAQALAQRGRDCLAVVGSRRSADRLASIAIPHQKIDLDEAELRIELPGHCSAIYLVPPGRNTDLDERLRRFCTCLPDTVSAFTYVSTSGVYGDQQGRLVNELTEPAPYSARARRRLNAEEQVISFCKERGIAWAIARVPGIYGPGRLPLQSLRDARPIIRVTEANPGNRIHRDDLARALVDLHEHTEASSDTLNSSAPGGIYNLGDNNYMSSSQFTLEVARMAGLPGPPQISREAMKTAASSVRWSFLAESRRLDSRKILGVLTRPLQYSNPLLGIRASLDAPDDPAA